jgi:CDP-diacylglycerol--glycerol-3-phosphate 3-phosphatidyltransferase
MLNISNILSLLRAPLALVFLQENPFYRMAALLLALVTDGLDGFLARRWKHSTQLGAIIDPVMDKFFALFVFSILLIEGKVEIWQVLSMLSRDFAILIFGAYLVLSGRFGQFKMQAIWTGKAATLMQYIILFLITSEMHLSEGIFALPVVLGFAALGELFLIDARSMINQK